MLRSEARGCDQSISQMSPELEGAMAPTLHAMSGDARGVAVPEFLDEVVEVFMRVIG